MSKDPAFLLYTSDFLTGTFTMSNDQLGKYIKLLCLQHQKGRLTIEEMIFVCGDVEETVFAKFTKDENGKYYNKRLEHETEKRKKYSDSRRNNRKSPKKQSYDEHMSNICKTYDEDMNNICKSYDEHMENINSINNNKKPVEILNENLDKAEEILKSVAWQEEVAMKLKLTPAFVKSKLEYFLTKQSLIPDFKTKTINDVKAHFVNWIAKVEPEATPTKKRNQSLL